jgi:hypothetical protein
VTSTGSSEFGRSTSKCECLELMAGIEELHAEIIAEFPTFQIFRKSDSHLMLAIDCFLRFVTLGRQTRFLTEYHTVLGNSLFVAPTWQAMDSRERIILLRHERVHLRQRRKWGTLAMAFLYLIPFFPIGLAYGRARLEWEAYQESLLATMELHGLETACSAMLRECIVRRFTGPDYVWMWPFRRTIESWYDDHIEALRQLDSSSARANKSGTLPA